MNIDVTSKTVDSNWKNIRRATTLDISRISEIYVFNNREIYYPIFRDIDFSFKELQVLSYSKKFNENMIDNTYVYDDGVVKGFVIVCEHEINKLHIERFFRGKGVGSALLTYAMSFCDANHLWVLKKNKEAIKFYKKHGLVLTTEEKNLQGVDNHTEPVVKMVLSKDRGEL